MTIRFLTKMVKDSDEKVVDFTSQLKLDYWEDYEAYIFSDPNSNTEIRIEISEKKINIFQSYATVNLELNKDLPSTLSTEYGNLNFIYRMLEFKKEENYIYFNYDLFFADKKFISNHTVELFINK